MRTPAYPWSINKKAFSLVELIISIVLLGIIVTFLYSTISNLEKTNRIFASNEKKLSDKEKIVDLLYNDIFTANTLELKGFENSLVSMQTSNSLFDIAKPFVTWLVVRDKNTLLRFESIKEFKNINSQNSDYFHISKVGENCEVFKIYQSHKKENILIHLKFKDQEPMVYEFSKPLFIKEPIQVKTPGNKNPSNPVSPNNNEKNVQPKSSLPAS